MGSILYSGFGHHVLASWAAPAYLGAAGGHSLSFADTTTVQNWWFPGDGLSCTPTLGRKIDDLFYLIMVIVAVTFVGTNAGYWAMH